MDQVYVTTKHVAMQEPTLHQASHPWGKIPLFEEY